MASAPHYAFDLPRSHPYTWTAGWSSPVARWAHNPKVVGSNPTPATKNLQILNGFRMKLGGRFRVWRELRQILGKESLVKQCSKLPGYTAAGVLSTLYGIAIDSSGNVWLAAGGSQKCG
jgi:hypothetical protein